MDNFLALTLSGTTPRGDAGGAGFRRWLGHGLLELHARCAGRPRVNFLRDTR